MMNRRPENGGSVSTLCGRHGTKAADPESPAHLRLSSGTVYGFKSKLSLPEGKIFIQQPASCSNHGVGKTAFPIL
jgi:hypothetical protein